MIEDTLIQWDQGATLWINSLNTPATDMFWALMSDTRVWFPAYAVLAFMLFRRLGWKKGLAVLMGVVLTVVLCDQIPYHIRNAVQRLRPCFTDEMVSSGLHLPANPGGGFWGFFSCHASNVFGLITCALIGFRNDKAHTYNGFAFWGYLWASLVSISRIMLGRHYLGDVLVGVAFGLVVGWGIAMITRRLIQKIGI